MPEGPEVRIITESLNEKLRGSKLSSIDIGPKSKEILGLESINLPSMIYGVTCSGKKIIFILVDRGRYKFIQSSLGLTGSWNWKSLNNTHLTLRGVDSSGGEFVACYDDPLKYGNISVFDSLDLLRTTISSTQGPDLLDAAIKMRYEGTIAITYESYSLQFTSRRMEWEICKFLLEQKIYSGIGNYLKAEILYEVGIHPMRRLKDLSEEDKRNLYEKSLKIIYDAYSYNGLTLKSYWDPDGLRGTYPTKVYSMEYCHRGHKVVKITCSDKRTTHLCQTCQT